MNPNSLQPEFTGRVSISRLIFRLGNHRSHVTCEQDPVSISDKTSYCKISWRLEAAIGSLNCFIALRFDRRVSSSAAAGPVKFQSDWTILNPILAALRLHDILLWDVLSDIETGPRGAYLIIPPSAIPQPPLQWRHNERGSVSNHQRLH